MALASVFLGLCGYLVRQIWRRQRARQRAVEARRDQLPSEYRFQPESARFRVWLYILAGVAAITGGLTFGGPGAAVAMLVAVLPFMVVASRHRSEHHRDVIQAVTRRAPMMETAELYDLVEALEDEHGSREMRPLRELLQGRL